MSRAISVIKLNIFDRDDLFFLAYMFLFFNAMISTYLYFDDSLMVGMSYVSRILYVLFLLACAASLILRRTYSVWEILSVGGLLLLGILSFAFADSHIFLDLTLILLISKNIDFNRFMKRAVILLALFLFVVICLACLDILSSVVKTRADNDQMRNSLGFGHPNALGLMVFQLIAGIIVLERKQLKTVHMWLLLALGVIFYLISKSQTCLIGVILLIAAVLIYKWVERRLLRSRPLKIVSTCILIAVTAAVVFAILYYWRDPGSLGFETLSGRLINARQYLDAYGVHLFGREIITGRDIALPGYSSGYFYLDNGEVWYLVRLGIVGAGVFFYTYVRMIIKAINKREIILCIIAAVYLIYSLTENSALRVPFNFMIIYAGTMLYSGNLLKKEMTERRSPGNRRYVSRDEEIIRVRHEQIN